MRVNEVYFKDHIITQDSKYHLVEDEVFTISSLNSVIIQLNSLIFIDNPNKANRPQKGIQL